MRSYPLRMLGSYEARYEARPKDDTSSASNKQLPVTREGYLLYPLRGIHSSTEVHKVGSLRPLIIAARAYAAILGVPAIVFFLAVIFCVCFPPSGIAQTRTWSVETVDTSATYTSLAVDSQGNVHIAYGDGDTRNLRYAFRPVNSSRWFTMTVDSQLQEFSTHLALDSEGRPHICYTPRMLKYAHWDGKQWRIQRVEPTGTIEFTCSVAVASDGTPHLAWYQTRIGGGENFYHLKYAVLKSDIWLARTVDFDGEAGKWSSLVLDDAGRPTLAYSRFPTSILKLAEWSGKEWRTSVIDSAGLDHVEGGRGMGNSMVRDAQGTLYVSYYHNEALRFAVRRGDRWVVQSVDSVSPRGGWVGFWSSLALDHQESPQISYEDGGSLKLASWDGKQWHIQLITPGGNDPNRFSSIGIAPDDTIYISYRDPQDGSLKVAVGHLTSAPAQTAVAAPRAIN